ncbi:MAG: toxic anion resistance protein [Chloroflexota bacterium]
MQTAFDNIYDTIDMISTYKVEALDNMRTTVNTLASEVERANAYLDRVQQRELAAATSGL